MANLPKRRFPLTKRDRPDACFLLPYKEGPIAAITSAIDSGKASINELRVNEDLPKILTDGRCRAIRRHFNVFIVSDTRVRTQ